MKKSRFPSHTVPKLCIALASLLSLILLLSACNTHEHTPFWQTESLATCTEDGARYQQCSGCSERLSENEVIPATGHTEEVTAGSAPSCTNEGKKDTVSCSVCGEYIRGGETISMLEHDFNDGICSVCGGTEYNGLIFTPSEDESYYIVSATYGYLGPGESFTIPSSLGGIPVREIADYGFSSLSLVKNLTVPASITKIGKEAFRVTGGGSSALTSVTILGAAEIGDSAFFACRSLTSLTLAEGVKSIGKAAFESTALTEVNIPASVETVGARAFINCTHVTAIVFAEGSAVTEIPSYTFSNAGYAAGRVTVTLPRGLEKIANNAFAYAPIAEISLPEGLKKIEYAAFEGCDIEVLEIPASTEEIGGGAFYKNPIKELYIPFAGKSRTATGSDKEVCYILGGTNSTVERLVFTAAASDSFTSCGISALESLIWLELPEGITSIGQSALSGCKAVSVTLPTTLTHIGANAFSGVSRLYEIINHSNIHLTAGSTDHGGIALLATKIASGSTDEGYESAVREDLNGLIIFGLNIIKYSGNAKELTLGVDSYIGYSISDSAFNGASIEKLTIGSGIASIGSSAFKNCQSLVSVDLTNSAESVLNNTFYNCTKLDEVILGSFVVRIETAFTGCYALTKLNLPSSLNYVNLWFEGTNAAGYAATLAAMDGISYQDGIYYLNGWAVGNNPDELPEELSLKSNTTGIAVGALPNSSAVKKLTVPTSVRYISEIRGSGYEEVYLPFLGHRENSPSSFSSVFSSASQLYYTLTKITINRGVIEDSAFSTSYSVLETVVLENGVTEIGSYAFSGSFVKSVYVGKNVSTIGDAAFRNATQLTSVSFADGCNLTSLGTGVFYGCSSLGGVAFPKGITVIPQQTFFGCTSIDAVVIGEGITEIGWEAFQGCTNLKFAVLPYTLTQVSYSIFGGCTSLSAVYYGADIAAFRQITVYGSSNTIGSVFAETTVYLYSAERPATSGNYWYIDEESGLPAIWN